MSEKLDFCHPLVRLQGGIEDGLSVRGRVGFCPGHGSC